MEWQEADVNTAPSIDKVDSGNPLSLIFERHISNLSRRQEPCNGARGTTAGKAGEEEMAKAERPVPEGYEVKFTPYVTLRSGRRLYARHYGRKSWRIVVRKRVEL